jgi:hypothetical protein
LLGDAEDKVAAAEVVEVVGEGAEGVEGVLRVPAGLELKAFPFDGVAVEQGGEIYRERHGPRFCARGAFLGQGRCGVLFGKEEGPKRLLNEEADVGVGMGANLC